MSACSDRVARLLLASMLIGAAVAAAEATRRFQIHPSIGIARVGDSPGEYYLAPDSWHRDFVPPGGYRDEAGKIKRMGVRFRIYELDADGNVLGEITSADAEIVWRVHLVNKKAAKDEPLGSGTPLNPEEDPAALTVDPGEQEIGSGERRELSGFIGPSSDIAVKLGELIATPEGRLIVLGGHGVAGSWKSTAPPPDGLHNPGWFDDTSDGPVRATLSFADGEAVRTFEARSAWVVVAPPDYAHPVMGVVTLYDLVRERSAAPRAAPAGPAPPVSFIRDVYPILRRVPHLQWTLMGQKATRFGRSAMHAHGIQGSLPVLQGAHTMHRGRADFFQRAVFQSLRLNRPSHPRFRDAQKLRQHILQRLKQPDGDASGGIGEDHSMPPLEELTLTREQYEILSRWARDDFEDDWDTTWNPIDPPAAFEPRFDRLAVADQPAALDRAALDGAVGGPFLPGIETGPPIADETTYDAPLHISDERVEPGDLTEGLSVPWQAGFNMATSQLYPSARPVYVIVKQAGRYTTQYWTRPYTERVPYSTPEDDPEMDDGMDYEAIYANQRMPRNLDMVEHWHRLGFLARDPTAGELVYVERDRAPDP